MKKRLYNKNNNNHNSMDLVKGSFEWAAVGISFFNDLIASAVVEILFAFHLEDKDKIMLTKYDDEYILKTFLAPRNLLSDPSPIIGDAFH